MEEPVLARRWMGIDVITKNFIMVREYFRFVCWERSKNDFMTIGWRDDDHNGGEGRRLEARGWIGGKPDEFVASSLIICDGGRCQV
mmetsp:Transcript_1444/g.3658  ORF Transcript_1444/g.3658 Transcript_1444/m.3658 type:complete len:86 (+) Transcript_1444:149-406(+)